MMDRLVLADTCRARKAARSKYSHGTLERCLGRQVAVRIRSRAPLVLSQFIYSKLHSSSAFQKPFSGFDLDSDTVTRLCNQGNKSIGYNFDVLHSCLEQF